jgi:hypothetical protein
MSEDEIKRIRAKLAADVLRLATTATEIADEHGVALDFSEASLVSLDRYLAELAEELTKPQKENAAELFAAYVLEVARRAHGGFFQWWEERQAPVLVVGAPECHIGILTSDKVRGRLNGDAADNLPFFYDGFATRARARAPGDSATYV